MSTPRKHLPPQNPTRTIQEYIALVEAALLPGASRGEQPTLPPPQSREELLMLMNRASAELDKLNSMIPSPDADSPPPLDLSQYTTEQKLALGEQNSRKLAEIALQIAPLQAMDVMERRLSEDLPSQTETEALLARLRNPPTRR